MFRDFLQTALGRDSAHIDRRLSALLGHASLKGFICQSKSLPAYRFADLYDAIEAFCAEQGEAAAVDSEHNENLNLILHRQQAQWADRRIGKAKRSAWSVSPDEERYLPVDRFWAIKGAGRRPGHILRLQFVEYQQLSMIEAASPDAKAAEAAIEWIIARANERSIYRNKLIQVSFEAGSKDQYGDVEKPEMLRVLFMPRDDVGDGDIVLDEGALKSLRRNVLDLHDRKDVLRANKVPLKRGVLLYGPPGTGKTYACRYLCAKLPGITRIVASGTALHRVGVIFALARMLQPALVVLEDVDLVFASRDINAFNASLGDLLDQMDGLRPSDEISIIMTTNAIERLESAVKDRPGRISQCIYMGAPDKTLRARYIKRYLEPFDAKAVTVGKLVDLSEGTTQAFLKEWVFRAAQIATERLDGAVAAVALQNEDFTAAFDEMRRFSDGAAGRIIGFLAQKGL